MKGREENRTWQGWRWGVAGGSDVISYFEKGRAGRGRKDGDLLRPQGIKTEPKVLACPRTLILHNSSPILTPSTEGQPQTSRLVCIASGGVSHRP